MINQSKQIIIQIGVISLIILIGVSGLGKTNVLLILTKHQRPDTDKI